MTPDTLRAAAKWAALKRTINDPESCAIRAALAELRK